MKPLGFLHMHSKLPPSTTNVTANLTAPKYKYVQRKCKSLQFVTHKAIGKTDFKRLCIQPLQEFPESAALEPSLKL